jgi:hypothetical protein
MATHWTLSPDQHMIAADPERGLWVAGAEGKHGRLFPITMQPSCVLAQYEWSRDGASLAYLKLCAKLGSTGEVESTLFIRSLKGAPSHLVAHLVSKDQAAIDIGVPYRCVLCGY